MSTAVLKCTVRTVHKIRTIRTCTSNKGPTELHIIIRYRRQCFIRWWSCTCALHIPYFAYNFDKTFIFQAISVKIVKDCNFQPKKWLKYNLIVIAFVPARTTYKRRLFLLQLRRFRHKNTCQAVNANVKQCWQAVFTEWPPLRDRLTNLRRWLTK